MKLHISRWTIIILLTTATAHAQNKPVSTNLPAAVGVTQPALSAPYINFVRVWEPNMPSTDTSEITTAARTATEVKQSTQYFDGLGRLVQTVLKANSPQQHDLVTPVVYDAMGREQYKYIPYAQYDENTADGKFKQNPFQSEKSFYRNATLNPGFTGDSIYYTQTEYERSPLNRVLKVYGPGSSWAIDGGNHPVESSYLVNSLADSVRIWNAGTGLPVSPGTYNAGQLYKVITTDEAKNQTIEFKDKEGHVILKKVQASATPDVTHAHKNWLCTYYVYDDLGRVVMIIPPLAVTLINGGWNLNTTVANELCFQYQYDFRNRVIVKTLPGVGPVNMVYDSRDRLVFMQDSVQRSKSPQEWLVNFYDGLNRQVMTALYKANINRADLQTSMNAVTDGSQTITSTFPAIADMVLDSYDGNSIYLATNSITLAPGFETTTNATVEMYIDATSGGQASTINVSNPLPGIAGSNALTPLTYFYYDNYDYPGAYKFQTGDVSRLRATSNPYSEAALTSGSTMTRGRVTGTKVRVLDTDTWLTTSTYYDDKGRTVQTIADNFAGGKDITTNQYDFRGKLLSTFLRHNNPRSAATYQTSVLTMMTYDHAGRLLNITKRLNEDSLQDKTIAANSYNELGALKQKRLAATTAGTQLDTLSYNYNIRGWLTGINKAYVNTTGSNTGWFGEEVNYDNGFSIPQFNGNISGVKWKTKSDGNARAFGYSYDNPKRLTAADFTQQNSGSTDWTQDKADFTVSGLAYDANGNIQSMVQKGMIGTSSTIVDSLTYHYLVSGSNKLMSVNDTSKTTAAKLGDFQNGAKQDDEYKYDVNGNQIQDLNKSITSITYNHLNKPTVIRVKGKGVISYQYDANGVKLRKTVVDSTNNQVSTQVTDYIGAFVYQQDTLRELFHEEGRIRPLYATGSPVRFTYDYFERDHLGDVRVVLGAQSDSSKYAATMETSATSYENALFANIDNTRYEISKIAGYPQDNTTNPNAAVARLNGLSGQKIGPSLVLRVMAGDTIQLGVKAFYKSTGTSTSANTSNDMLTALINAFNAGSVSEGAHAATGTTSPIATSFNSTDYETLKQKDPSQNISGKPRAYLNYTLFDDRFNMVSENSGVKQVQGSPDALQTLATDKMLIRRTGFIYIYTSNESGDDVYFDNLIVAHNSGPLLEETHYYPFGGTMAGISSRALKGAAYVENRMKYNGKEQQHNEFRDGTGLELYDYGARMYDAQVGRWGVVDPLGEKHPEWSPFAYCLNDPILRIDPDGLTDFTFDKNTGEVKQVGEANKDPDRILKTNSKGEVKYDKKGVAKVAVDGLAKGFLSDGQNYKSKDYVFSVGGEGQPTLANFEDFAVKMSDYIGVELGGVYLSNDKGADANISKVYLDNYANNTLTSNSPTYTKLYSDKEIKGMNLITDFHTHPTTGYGRSDIERPSGIPGDLGYRNDFRSNFQSFLILTRQANYPNDVQRIDYTNYNEH